jgi:xanthine dehydrogenase YagS FAD-binding subunit
LIGVKIENVTALDRAAAAGLADARPLRDNGFKVKLARRAIMRAVRQAAGVA